MRSAPVRCRSICSVLASPFWGRSPSNWSSSGVRRQNRRQSSGQPSELVSGFRQLGRIQSGAGPWRRSCPDWSWQLAFSVALHPRPECSACRPQLPMSSHSSSVSPPLRLSASSFASNHPANRIYEDRDDCPTQDDVSIKPNRAIDVVYRKCSRGALESALTKWQR